MSAAYIKFIGDMIVVLAIFTGVLIGKRWSVRAHFYLACGWLTLLTVTALAGIYYER